MYIIIYLYTVITTVVLASMLYDNTTFTLRCKMCTKLCLTAHVLSAKCKTISLSAA